jgi:hypothetical protein
MSNQRKTAEGYSPGFLTDSNDPVTLTDKWRIAQSHMSGSISSEPDPGEFLRRGAAESVGFRMGQGMAESRAELARNGGPEGVITAVVKRVDRQMRDSEARTGELNRAADALRMKLRQGER